VIEPAHVLAASSHETLVSVLAYERRLLEQLLFRHAELSLLIGAGEHRFVARAMDEVAAVEDELGATELIRAAVVDSLVPNAIEPNIDDVVRTSPQAWAPALEGLAMDLRRLHDGIEVHRRNARTSAARRSEMCSAAQRSLQAQGYRSDGSALLGA
jgi:hypothetical protein